VTSATSSAVMEAVAGDVQAVSRINKVSGPANGRQRESRVLTLMAETVASVVRGYDLGEITQSEAQQWAELMRWGLVSAQAADAHPRFDIEYEAAHESAIVEALARLDELGDIIDGELRPGEAAQLLRALEEPT
jgi:hypothetical protein